MIPKKIYLRENELEEQFMCERMVSCDASIGSCNVEYTDISQVWHDASEEPQQDRLMLGIDCEGASIYKWIGQDPNGWYSFVKYTGLSKWAYISDLLPK